jgi:serine/threonine-protein kinase HipA
VAEREPRTLDVWCFDRLAGRLTDADHGPVFAYDAQWLTDAQPPLSQSLPLDGTYTAEAAAAFFGGLLPEGAPRDLLARRLGVSPNNNFGMLAAVGGDTAGAISLQRPGEPPPAEPHDVEALDDDALIQVIDELPTRPMHADEDGEYRLSLAGAQDKLPVVVGPDGRIGLTRGQTPSTHILKTPIDRLDDTVVNEAFCPAIGRTLGIDAVEATPHRIGGREFLLVERYDRRALDGVVRRLHQEDFCQALGIPTHRKYQSEGGPSLTDCFSLVRRATDVPARQVVRLLDAVALSFLVGNHDAHGKNSSLLYLPETPEAVVAPAYDVLSTVAYHRSYDLTRKMAMSFGGEPRPEYLRPRHVDRMLGEAGLGAAAARRRLRAFARDAPAAARQVREELQRDGWQAPVLDRIVEIVDRRAGWLADLTAPASRQRAGAQPAT